ncbi:MAG: hypothetical protein IKG14_01145 [Clostridia bacterium]|nr:hypothetical protein [Clostridia bacterium]
MEEVIDILSDIKKVTRIIDVNKIIKVYDKEALKNVFLLIFLWIFIALTFFLLYSYNLITLYWYIIPMFAFISLLIIKNIFAYTKIEFSNNEIICTKGFVNKRVFNINNDVLIYSGYKVGKSKKIFIQDKNQNFAIQYNNVSEEQIRFFLNNLYMEKAINPGVNKTEYAKNIEYLEKWRLFLGQMKRTKGIKKESKTISLKTDNIYMAYAIGFPTLLGWGLIAIVLILCNNIPLAIFCATLGLPFLFIAYKIYKKSLKTYIVTSDGKLIINNKEFFSGYEMLYVAIERRKVFSSAGEESRLAYYLKIKSNNDYDGMEISKLNIKQVFELLNCFIYD